MKSLVSWENRVFLGRATPGPAARTHVYELWLVSIVRYHWPSWNYGVHVV